VKRWVISDEIAELADMRIDLPKAEKPANINNIEKYCTHCKKTGLKRDECWSLNDRSEKEQSRRIERDVGKEKQINTTVKVRKNKLQAVMNHIAEVSTRKKSPRQKQRELHMNIKLHK